ncbi:MAG: hypothetical protein WBM44_21890 [Waterburya sp.]
MTSPPQIEQDQSPENTNNSQPNKEEKILCPHCLRTATNGIKCKGMCVADDDY